MDKRTDVDFSNHVLEIVEYDGILIYNLLCPSKNIIFTNANGVLTVTGDYGNWLFSTEFHPASFSKVDDNYWNEYLQNKVIEKESLEIIYDGFDYICDLFTKASLKKLKNMTEMQMSQAPLPIQILYMSSISNKIVDTLFFIKTVIEHPEYFK